MRKAFLCGWRKPNAFRVFVVMECDWEQIFIKNKKKKYKHVDAPIPAYGQCGGKFPREALRIINYITNPDKIAAHSFLPFIGYDIEERRVSKIDKTKPKEQQKSIVKLRPIKYASHFDSLIYSYYAYLLYDLYEKKLAEFRLGDVVLAYRKSQYMNKIANNITFAKEIFDIIKGKNNNCLALAFDIKSFYDNIDHNNLKIEWGKLLYGNDYAGRLPADHFQIYKSLTDYSFVALDAVKMYLRCPYGDFLCKECESCPLGKGYKLPQKLFENMDEFHKFKEWYKKRPKIKLRSIEESKHQQILDKKRAFNFNLGILDKEAPFGIPQGSPMSALLANIYMLPFDMVMKQKCDEYNAVYRRYSDDILIICDKDSKEPISAFMMKAIKERGIHLIIHPIGEGRKSKSKCYDFSSARILQAPLQYLGFTFDGKDVKVRGASFARYLRKSARGIHSMRMATQNKIKKLVAEGWDPAKFKPRLNRTALYEKYTHLGHRNFWSYANRAFKDMECQSLRRQMNKHFERVKKLISDEDVLFAKFLSTLKVKRE